MRISNTNAMMLTHKAIVANLRGVLVTPTIDNIKPTKPSRKFKTGTQHKIIAAIVQINAISPILLSFCSCPWFG